MADRKISELVALTTPASGDYLPIIDISEAAAVSKNKRITIEELLRGAPDGTAAAPSIAFESDGGNGLYLAATDTIGISTNGVSRATISTTAITSALPIALSGSTSGKVTLTPVAIAGTTTITLPATTGTVVTTGDTGTVTSTMIADGTILNADVNASAAIAGTKISPDFGSQTIATTGIVSHALGTAGAPTVTFTGDTNTGIYSPGADQVAISTNGTGRLFVDSSGNVGINTASAIAPGGYGYAREFALTGATSGDSSAAINIRGSRTVAGGFGDINFWHQSTSNRAYIQARRGSSDSAIDLDFITSGGAGMRITSAGLVGIGTSSPVGRLNVVVAGTGDTSLALERTGSSRFEFQQGISAVTGDALLIKDTTLSYNYLTLRSGNVGVGTSSPQASARLHVYATGDYTDESAPFTVGDSTVGGMRLFFGINNTSNYGYIGSVESGTAYRSLVFQPGGGNVGVGTTNPGATLHVEGSELRVKNGTGVPNITLAGRDTDGTATLAFQNNGSSSNNAALTATTNTLAISTAGSERARIDSSGRLLVGTSSTSGVAKLQVQGYVGDDNGLGLLALRVGSSSPASGTSLGRIDFNDSTDSRGASITAERDGGTWGASSKPSRLVFSSTADGASSPTEALRITNDRVICYNQPAPASYAAAATLTVADLKTGIIQYTGAAATLTLPTGTLTEGGFSGVYTNMTFEWSLINTGTGTATVGAGTNHTIVGLATCVAGNSARFATRRTAANTFVSYRIV